MDFILAIPLSIFKIFYWVISFVFGIFIWPFKLLWGLVSGIFSFLLSIIFIPFSIFSHPVPSELQQSQVFNPTSELQQSQVFNPTVSNSVVESRDSRSGCDNSYPDVCIPLSDFDLDCKDVTDRNFQVLPPDPHNFDRDKDGLGCER